MKNQDQNEKSESSKKENSSEQSVDKSQKRKPEDSITSEHQQIDESGAKLSLPKDDQGK